jgi:hypothetical protein
MIQDAFPVRSGTPDGYLAFYEIDVVVAASTWTLNKQRMPSGFNGAGVAPGADASNGFVSTGRADFTFPAGNKVRGANASVDSKGVTGAQAFAFVANINEAAGTFSVITTLTGAPATLANPAVNSTIYVELDLETI